MKDLSNRIPLIVPVSPLDKIIHVTPVITPPITPPPVTPPGISPDDFVHITPPPVTPPGISPDDFVIITPPHPVVPDIIPGAPRPDVISDFLSDAGIVIQILRVRAAAAKMKTLASRVQSRSLQVDFTYSRGDTVSQLTAYADSLKKTGDAMALLFSQTAAALEKTAARFKDTDERLAAFFKGK